MDIHQLLSIFFFFNGVPETCVLIS